MIWAGFKIQTRSQPERTTLWDCTAALFMHKVQILLQNPQTKARQKVTEHHGNTKQGSWWEGGGQSEVGGHRVMKLVINLDHKALSVPSGVVSHHTSKLKAASKLSHSPKTLTSLRSAVRGVGRWLQVCSPAQVGRDLPTRLANIIQTHSCSNKTARGTKNVSQSQESFLHLYLQSMLCNFVQTCSHTWMKTLSRTYFTSSLSNTSARSHAPVWSQLGPSAPANQQSVLQRGTQTPLKHMSPWKHLKIRCFPSPALRPAGTCKAHRITSEGNRGGREERGRKNSSSMRKFYCTPPPLPSSLAPSITLLVLLLPVSQRESRTETRLQHRWGKLLTSLSR